MEDLLARWAECDHDQNNNHPHYAVCSNGCGAWVEYIEDASERVDPDIYFELRWYVIQEEPDAWS